MFERLRKIPALVSSNVDARDWVLVFGLVLVAVGLSQIYLPAAFVVPGVVLTYVAIFGAKTGGGGDS